MDIIDDLYNIQERDKQFLCNIIYIYIFIYYTIILEAAVIGYSNIRIYRTPYIYIVPLARHLL